MPQQERFAFIDGLRAIAVGLVLLHHAWMPHPPHRLVFAQQGGRLEVVHPSGVFDWVAGRGYLGLSLFLVISGFCLAYPPLRRRREGRPDWFVPSDFFARRCVRILPPYYAALFLCLAARWLFAREGWPPVSIFAQGISAPNLVSHLFLVHNLVPQYGTSIDAPLWSLGLEWQWYWVFPIVLAFCARSPVLVGSACLALAVAWGYASGDVLAHASWLPGRLFEFWCGVMAAWLVVRGRVPPLVVLVSGMAAALVAAEVPRFDGVFALYQPLYGIAFALFLLIGQRSHALRRLLSVRPLVGLGVISYSLYLVHYPVVLGLEELSPQWLRSSPLMSVVAAGAAIAVGWLFYTTVERHFVHPASWRRTSTLLRRSLAWTDGVGGSRPRGTRRQQAES